MKKTFKIAGIVFGVVFVVLATFYSFRNKIIVTAVETFVPQMTKTAVSLGEVNFQPFKGSVSIKDLKIANPKGFSAPNIFTLGEISVKIKPASLISNKIIIKDILIDKVAVTYELLANGTSNIAVIQKNVTGEAKTENTKQVDKKQSTDTKEKSSKTVVIKKFQLKNSSVSAVIAGIKLSLPLPPLTLTGIGEDKPSTPADVFAKIMTIFSQETIKEVTNATTKALKDGASSLKSVLDKLF